MGRYLSVILCIAVMSCPLYGCIARVDPIGKDGADPTTSTEMGEIYFYPGANGAYTVNDGAFHAWGEFCRLFSVKYLNIDYVSAFIRIADEVPDIRQVVPYYSVYSLILTEGGDVYGCKAGWGASQMSEAEQAEFWESLEGLNDREEWEKGLELVKLSGLKEIKELIFCPRLEPYDGTDDFYCSTVYAISRSGEVYGMGIRVEYTEYEGDAIGVSEHPFISRLDGIPTIRKVTVSYGTRVILAADGKVYSIGNNDDGQLGDGTDVDYSTALVRVKGLEGVVDIVGDAYCNVYALTSDGKVYSWGRNYRSQLGVDGDELYVSNVPVDIGLTGIRSIYCDYMINDSSAGLLVAIDKDGYVHAPPIWEGWNDGWDYRSGYVRVPGIANAKEAAVNGSCNIYVLTEDGDVYAFGDGDDGNRYGQMGNGVTAATKSRVKVGGLPPIVRIYAYNDSVFAVAEDGAIYAWGKNRNGQLGIGKAMEDYAIHESQWGYKEYDAYETKPVRIDGLNLLPRNRP